ncbi:MAG TPA: acetyl-CoA carboxylase biotin carboxyl carrier protein [Lacunisphaera sp.]|nr:acetyl-CoA carboxylase biotin carboxyl carrier protein [Lacunisphaera sp.]
MDLKQIKQIIELMKRSELSEFEFEEEGFKIKIKRGSNGFPNASGGSGSAHPFTQISAPVEAAPAAPQKAVAPVSSPGADESGFTYVKSPMVGTFYRSPSPENPPFVDINAKVEEKTVVCIIEAMKIMNEIQAETKGTVVEVLVENGQPVEYGQRLFKIKLG